MVNRSYPATRLRRLRQAAFVRDMVAESRLHASDLIWPLFVIEGTKVTDPISAMPGVFRQSIDQLITQAQKAVSLGIPAIAIFPKIESDLKDADGSGATDGNNLVCRAVKAVKAACPQLGIICDVALDPFTDHGHDGILKDGKIDNDETIVRLCEQAVIQAQAGCDIIAPSDMMDGRIGAIRSALDKAGFQDVMILSYAAKYASAFYGPFRDAVGAGKGLGPDGKKTYQMNPANHTEALYEIEMDITEGADMVMVKPGMPYLDVLYAAKTKFGMPCFAYQVSGEYAMLRHAVDTGLFDNSAIMESLLCFKRAGADGILTYFAPEIASQLAED
ncbi:MAG: porphobilinogen synthase [Candidatus Puniceispirillaceae bacterium]